MIEKGNSNISSAYKKMGESSSPKNNNVEITNKKYILQCIKKTIKLSSNSKTNTVNQSNFHYVGILK
jgi:hypothetical protein